MHAPDAFGIHMRVYLRGYNVGMPQQLLHNTQIRTAGKQVSRKGMPQHVRMHMAYPRLP